MTRTSALASALGFLLLAAPTMCIAQTLNNHSYVSSTGSDLGTCLLASPCRFIRHAIDQTVNDGVVSCLDGGNPNFGGMVITKSITIDCSGFPAAVLTVTINGSGIS